MVQVARRTQVRTSTTRQTNAVVCISSPHVIAHVECYAFPAYITWTIFSAVTGPVVTPWLWHYCDVTYLILIRTRRSSLDASFWTDYEDLPAYSGEWSCDSLLFPKEMSDTSLITVRLTWFHIRTLCLCILLPYLFDHHTDYYCSYHTCSTITFDHDDSAVVEHVFNL